MAPLRYDFAMLRECRIVIPLSCTYDKLHPRSHSSAIASRLDLVRSKPHGPYAACETIKGRWILRCSEVAGSLCMLHVKLLREDGFYDAVRLQDRDTFEMYP